MDKSVPETQRTKSIIFVALIPLFFLLSSQPVFKPVIALIVSLIFAWLSSSWIKTALLRLFGRKVSPEGKAVLISGCDNGIGHGAALALNKVGFTVFATCLNDQSDGARTLKLKASNPHRMIVIKLDVTSDGDVESSLATVRSHLRNRQMELWAIVNNAAVSRTGKLEWGDLDFHFRELFEVNVFGAVRLTRKFLPCLRESKGRVVVISSLAGRVTDASMAAYSMSKHALTSFADGLRLEVARFGVKVTCIEPWFARTPMMESSVALNRLNAMWSKTDPKIRKVYGERDRQVLDRSIKLLTQEPGLGLDESYHATLASILRNVTSFEPEYSEMACSLWQRPILYVIQFLPREWVDLLLASFSVGLEVVARVRKAKKSDNRLQ